MKRCYLVLLLSWACTKSGPKVHDVKLLDAGGAVLERYAGGAIFDARDREIAHLERGVLVFADSRVDLATVVKTATHSAVDLELPMAHVHAELGRGGELEIDGKPFGRVVGPVSLDAPELQAMLVMVPMLEPSRSPQTQRDHGNAPDASATSDEPPPPPPPPPRHR